MSTHGPEYKLQVKVLKALRRLPGLWCYKAHDQCTPGIPDIIGCLRGRMFAIELKAPGEVPTAIQRRTLALLRAAGASVGPAWTVEQALNIVKMTSLTGARTPILTRFAEDKLLLKAYKSPKILKNNTSQ